MIPDSAAEASERELQQSTEENGEIVDVSETQPLLDNGEPATPKTTFSSFTAREWGILVMLASANLWSIVAFSCIAPFYPMEAKKKGLSDFEIGLTFGIFELMIFLASPIAGKLGILQTCGGIGFSLGPFLGGILYDMGGFRLPFYSLGVAMFLMAFLSRWLIPRDQVDAKYLLWPQSGRRKVKFGPRGVTAPLNGMLVDRFKCHLGGMMVAPAAIIISLSLNGPSPFLPLTKSLPLVIISQIIFGAGLSTLQIPTYRNTLEAAEKAGFEDGTATYGLISGLFEAVYSFGAFVGPTAGGLIQQHFGFAWTVTVISAFHLCFLMMFSVFYIYKKCKRKEEDINA
ncbi:hypothetical protein ANCCEY_05070 [Ancylostoma ceylanicum]|uniref:Major facilitator superfamily (MFS) profile domain-containing protein n=1 Tax=Ancylostoma ceylanicum TaxID=53326 RepID=A0A0D6LUW3_9BILA|nr:hypothetical protein ANCCEY_05070 [Ancylostoma ceylanicum]